MRGHLVKRYKNSWTVVLDLGRDANGKRKQRWISVKGTKPEAEKVLTDALHQKDTGSLINPSKVTFGEFLEHWLKEYALPNLAPRTYEGYASIINEHLIPKMGVIPLSKLKPEHVRRYYAETLENGRCNGSGGLSAQSVRHHHMAIHKALETACKWGLVFRNVADNVDPPHAEKPQMVVWNEDEVKQFLEAARETRYYALYVLALYTGARRSELLALRWEDVDLIYCQVSINRTVHQLRDGSYIYRQPKTAKSRRTIALPPSAALVMTQYREARDTEAEKVGRKIPEDELVFGDGNGKPIRPNTVTRAWPLLAVKAGVKPIRFHDARHTHASLMLKQGAHPKIVQERLGHATISVTLDTYSHIAPGMQEAAARKFDDLDLIPEAKNGLENKVG